MRKTFTFNRLGVLFFLLPLAVILVFLVLGFIREQNIFVLVMIIVTLVMLVPFVWLSFLRRLTLTKEKAIWKTPKTHYEINLAEVNHYGIIKFRSFRFIYLSKSEEPPFEKDDSHIVTDENTFVIQFRKSAYYFLEDRIHEVKPDLQPRAYRRI